MSELPATWQEVEIIEVLAPNDNGKPFQQGWSPQCERFPTPEGAWGVLKTTAIQHGEFRPHENKALPAHLDPRPHIEVKAGDVVMTCAGPRNRCGVACLVEHTRPRLMLSGKMYRFRPHPDGLEPKYLAYLLQRHETQLEIDRMKTGINDSGLNLTHDRFAALRVPLAPFREQHRIVAKIEELFSELDKAVESLRIVRVQLGTYRQAFLKVAFEGKLTTEWRASNRDEMDRAQTILASIHEGREARYKRALSDWQSALAEWHAGGKSKDRPTKPRPPEKLIPENSEGALRPNVPADWERCYLGELDVDIFDGPFGSNLKTNDYVDAGVRVIRLENIGSGRFINDKVSYVSAEKYEAIKKHTVKPGDIVFSSFVVDSIRSALVPATIPFAVNKADCFAVRVHGEAFRAKFLQFFLESRNAFKQVEGMIHGVGRPRINTTQLKEISVPVCSIREQDIIIELLEQGFNEIDRFDLEADLTLSYINNLRQSILKQAFLGQLVAQDQSDEPVSALLARLHEQAPPHRTRRRKTA